jgi:hypothetical protein
LSSQSIDPERSAIPPIAKVVKIANGKRQRMSEEYTQEEIDRMTEEQFQEAVMEEHKALLAERKSNGRRGRAKAAPRGTIKQLRLGGSNGIGGQEIYDRLCQVVAYNLVKTRYMPSLFSYTNDSKIEAEEQVQWITDVTNELNITDRMVINAAISSVKDWVSNKSCRMRQYFYKQGTQTSPFARLRVRPAVPRRSSGRKLPE